jgi:phosphatidylglycerophosphate synthase
MEDPVNQPLNRRPMGLRSNALIVGLANRMRQKGITPNSVSIASAVISIAAGALLVASGRYSNLAAAVMLIVIPALIGLRGLCNLIDGMIAVEGGLKTKSGEIFNDVPDRVSDLFLFAGAGYAAFEQEWAVPLGWTAASLSIATAYVRMLGAAVGSKQYFSGPMAKPMRMAVLSLGCVACGIERLMLNSTWTMVAALAVIALGSLLTCVIRVRQIYIELERS